MVLETASDFVLEKMLKNLLQTNKTSKQYISNKTCRFTGSKEAERL